ncbi:MAG: hypothetical protein AAFV95_03655 [Bacteroidota bacterium]
MEFKSWPMNNSRFEGSESTGWGASAMVLFVWQANSKAIVNRINGEVYFFIVMQ